VLVVDHVQDEDAARQRVLAVVDGDPDRVLAARPWAAKRVPS
jgi:hypothetical protein